MVVDVDRAWSVGRLVVKPLLMPAIALLAAPRGPRSPRVVTAQACSWVGDVALIGRSRTPFLVGLSAFLAAHVAYVAAYRERSSVPLLATPGRRRFLLAGAAASGGMALAAGRRERAMAAPVAAYGATLAAMVTAAAAVDADRGRGRVLAGACLFLVPDTLIGVRRFVTDRHPHALEAAILSTYASGQWLIASGLATDPERYSRCVCPAPAAVDPASLLARPSQQVRGRDGFRREAEEVLGSRPRLPAAKAVLGVWHPRPDRRRGLGLLGAALALLAGGAARVWRSRREGGG